MTHSYLQAGVGRLGWSCCAPGSCHDITGQDIKLNFPDAHFSFVLNGPWKLKFVVKHSLPVESRGLQAGLVLTVAPAAAEPLLLCPEWLHAWCFPKLRRKEVPPLYQFYLDSFSSSVKSVEGYLHYYNSTGYRWLYEIRTKDEKKRGLMYSKKQGTDVFYHQGSGTASQATPRGRHRIRAEVGFELAI